VFGGDFTDANALSALLTVESLLLTGLGFAVSLSGPDTRVRDLPVPTFVLGYIATGFLSAVAFGALMAWWNIFVTAWPGDFRGSIIAGSLALAIVGQPLFAWSIARGLRPKR